MEKAEGWAIKILEPSGIKINGNYPWDIKVLNQNFYNKVMANGSLGLGESYMAGWWDCDNLDQFFYKLLASKIPAKIGLSLPAAYAFVSAKLFNLQSKDRAFQVGQKHYDLDNKLFSAMLGRTMAYSCGYWKKAKDLDSAQDDKFDLICKKLHLKPGQKILDIGCGWGGFANYAAKKYKVSVVGITVSKEQSDFAKKLCKGLPVEIKVQDYRDLQEKFDHIVSVGMFEHVGPKNYETFFNIVRNSLKDNGLFLLHTIGSPVSGHYSDPWLNKYIFPNGALPSLQRISKAIEKIFIVEDLHNFSADYDKTLVAWYKNFEKNWPKFKNKYDDIFYRMWKYYLLSCAGGFRSRQTQLWQIILSPQGVAGGYKPVR